MKNFTLVVEKTECVMPESILKSFIGVSSIIECGMDCQLEGAKSLIYGRGDYKKPCSCVCYKPTVERCLNETTPNLNYDYFKINIEPEPYVETNNLTAKIISIDSFGKMEIKFNYTLFTNFTDKEG